MIRTNFIYIQKHQSQEADNASRVCYSNNFRKKNYMSVISINLQQKAIWIVLIVLHEIYIL